MNGPQGCPNNPILCDTFCRNNKGFRFESCQYSAFALLATGVRPPGWQCMCKIPTQANNQGLFNVNIGQFI